MFLGRLPAVEALAVEDRNECFFAVCGAELEGSADQRCQSNREFVDHARDVTESRRGRKSLYLLSVATAAARMQPTANRRLQPIPTPVKSDAVLATSQSCGDLTKILGKTEFQRRLPRLCSKASKISCRPWMRN